jgi:hypothetical protein
MEQIDASVRRLRGFGTQGGQDWHRLSFVVVEQRLDAVRAVLRGAVVVEVAVRVGVHRSTMQR